MQADTPDAEGAREERLTRVIARLVDLVLPGAGMLLAGRVAAGVLALAGWGMVLLAAAWAVCGPALPPVRALAFVGIEYTTVQALLMLTPLGTVEDRSPGRAALGISIFVAGMALALGLGFGSRYALVTLPDLGEFPAFLPGEVILAARQDFQSLPPAPGDLVVARVDDTHVVARVVGVAGDRVDLSGASLTVNEAAVPADDLGEVRLRGDDPPHPGEARSLHAYLETLGDSRHVIFFRRGVTMAPVKATVPEGQVYLLADNRSTAETRDSREIGPVPLEALIARPLRVLWTPVGSLGDRLTRLGAEWM